MIGQKFVDRAFYAGGGNIRFETSAFPAITEASCGVERGEQVSKIQIQGLGDRRDACSTVESRLDRGKVVVSR